MSVIVKETDTTAKYKLCISALRDMRRVTANTYKTHEWVAAVKV
jgi:hypothetical protein